MENIRKTTYKLPNTSKQWLLSHNFHYNRLFSDNETEIYTYRFPVYKYEKFTVLECELRVTLGDNNVQINVYDYGTINRYAPFYYSEYGNYNDVLKNINVKINKELNKLKISKKHKMENYRNENN